MVREKYEHNESDLVEIENSSSAFADAGGIYQKNLVYRVMKLHECIERYLAAKLMLWRCWLYVLRMPYDERTIKFVLVN